ncbi:MAG: cache domain-containing protein [Cyanobacteria bacterium J06638_28]
MAAGWSKHAWMIRSSPLVAIALWLLPAIAWANPVGHRPEITTGSPSALRSNLLQHSQLPPPNISSLNPTRSEVRAKDVKLDTTHAASNVSLTLAKGQVKSGEESEAPSPWWLIVMPAIPIMGGGLIYTKRRWLNGIASLTQDAAVASSALPPNQTLDELSQSVMAVSSRKYRHPAIVLVENYFPLIGIATVTLTSFITYVVMRSQLTVPVFQDLEVVAETQKEQLDSWFRIQRAALLQANTLPEALPEVEQLLTPAGTDADDDDAVQEDFAAYIEALPAFRGTESSIALLTNGGIVTYATDPQREGQYQPLQNTTTYITEETTDVLPNLYVSPLTDELQITLATPILKEEGQRLGVFAVDLDLADLAQKIARLPDPEAVPVISDIESREIYLVGRASLVKNQVISPDQDFQVRYREGVNSRGIEQAIGRLNGAELYLNYAKKPVIGVYRWAPDYNLALLAEVAQAEIFSPARIVARYILGIGFVAVGILTLLLWWSQKARAAKLIASSEIALSSESIGSNSPDP